jgi:hypothetical protein
VVVGAPAAAAAPPAGRPMALVAASARAASSLSAQRRGGKLTQSAQLSSVNLLNIHMQYSAPLCQDVLDM